MSTLPTPVGIWATLPKQPKQARCRVKLAHEGPKRTFYWIMEAGGVICQDCVNVRETRKSFPPSEPEQNGNGNSGKKRKSIVPPQIKSAIIARRAAGQYKSHIAKEVGVAHNTVSAVIEESQIDRQISERINQARVDATDLIPQAFNGLKTAFAKGDGSTSCRFLEGIGVLGENAGAMASGAASLRATFERCQVLIQQAGPQPEAKPVPVPGDEVTQS